MKKLVYLFFLFPFISCQNAPTPMVDEILNADLEFSAMAVEKGYNKAFIEYAHPEAVLLRENSMPIVGKEKVIRIFEKANPEGINFSWAPIAGNIALSGELGYTYGIYTIKRDTIIQKGTYVSVWKKDETGNWKYILDSGNEGVGEENNDE